MAQRRGGYQGSFERCGRCKGIASKWSVYSDRMLCNSCLSFERAAYEVRQPERDAIAANVAQAAREIAAENAAQAQRAAELEQAEAAKSFATTNGWIIQIS